MDTTLIDALRAQLQRETGQPVALVETHISWVLLTPTQALKLKKPVRLGRRACTRSACSGAEPTRT